MNDINPQTVAVQYKDSALSVMRSSTLAVAYQLIGDTLAAGDSQRALYITEQLLLQHGEYVPLLWMKAYILEVQGIDWNHRLQFCEQALAIDPQHFEFCLMKGDLLRKLARHHESIDWYQACLAFYPDRWELYTSLGITLNETTETQRAEAVFRKALALNKYNAIAWFQLIGITEFSRQDLNQMQASLKKKNISPSDKAQIAFAIAAYWRKLANVESEAHYLKMANEIQAVGQNYNAAANKQIIQQTIEQFDRSTFEKISSLIEKTQSELSSKAIFIVGMPRSGSTMLEQMLAQQPDMTSTGESCLLEICLSQTSNRKNLASMRPSLIPALSEQSIIEFRQNYEQRISTAVTTPVYSDKSLDNYRIVGLIKAAFPESKIISIERHPLDIILSCYQNSFGDVAYSNKLSDLTKYYINYRKLMAHWQSVFEQPFLSVQYEQLVADPETQAKQICEYCELDWRPEMLDFHLNKAAVNTVSKQQVRSPIYATSVSRWKPYEKLLQPVIRKLEAEGYL